MSTYIAVNFWNGSGHPWYPGPVVDRHATIVRLFNVSIKLEDKCDYVDAIGLQCTRRVQRQHPSQRQSFNVKVEYLYAKTKKKEKRQLCKRRFKP